MSGVEHREIKLIDPIRVKINQIHPNEWNPNQQSDETFNMLVEEIREDGFDHPVNLVPCECGEIAGLHYKLIGGEHRWRSAHVLGMPEILAVVHTDWDEIQQKLKTVRRNLLSGDLNPQKFTELVRSLDGRIDRASLPKLMGFTDDREFEKSLLKDSSKARDKSFVDSLMDDAKKAKVATDTITDIVANIFAGSDETLPANFLLFGYKGKTHLCVLCDEQTWKAVTGMIDQIKLDGTRVTEFLTEAIERKLS
jgi:hypothetical protein